MWIIYEPKIVALWNKWHFEEKKGECAACLKYSVLIFVEKKIYKMQHLEGSGMPVLYIKIIGAPNNARKWQMGFNLAFKGLKRTWCFSNMPVSTNMNCIHFIFLYMHDGLCKNEVKKLLEHAHSVHVIANIHPFRSYIGPHPTVWFSSSAPMSEDVWHGFCRVCLPAVGACPMLFLR
jgi:hypothetical protein